MPEQTDLRVTGERIEALLDASAAGGPAARERAEELVRVVVELYGAGLQRILELLDENDALDDDVLDHFADDPLVSGLLQVHGLHPYGIEERVERALEKVRPYLGSHGGNVELLGVSHEGVVQLRMLGSCDGCQSSAVTLKLAVESAIEAAAPEVIRIDVETPTADKEVHAGFISVDSLTAGLRSRTVLPADSTAEGSTWVPLPDAETIRPGAALGLTVGGVDLVICRIGAALFAYRDGCGQCGARIAGAPLERRLGSAVNAAVLTCPSCRKHFSVERAGIGLDGTTGHLDPLPILVRDGIVEIALPAAVPA